MQAPWVKFENQWQKGHENGRWRIYFRKRDKTGYWLLRIGSSVPYGPYQVVNDAKWASLEKDADEVASEAKRKFLAGRKP